MSDTKLTDEQRANVRKLIAALRSGKYQQVPARLHTDQGFCCLGVACDLLFPERWEKRGDGEYHNGISDLGGKAVTILPEDVQELLGCGDNRGFIVEINGVNEHLAIHNDNGRTFAEIADAIESQILNA